MIEEWKDIKDFEGLYQVSNLGRVKSLDRCYFDRRLTGKLLKLNIRQSGKYYFVILCKFGKPYAKDVHRLVADAFCQRGEKDQEVDHIDRNKLNNAHNNLRWLSISANRYNSAVRDRAASKYNGVKKSGKKWRSTIRIKNKIICLGTFTTEADAARSFNNYVAMHKLNRVVNTL